ncbi:hypothetical protein J32TS6_41590 [Virgibacillus pantothenticus]|uniref:ImmA/IrrE family metallo-endopeptidase n=1 Tax=Virgibacillus TaxID=84406 RepID=UPI000FFEF7F1|nr:ImmA/IrrE family metallo-endopeptidase [Virgibacillus sp. 19R1-5]MBU8566998.1 ImmA/IrrE family metallo-endopeptidase [Virgibacillus pantothenticus]MBU8601922.1 ImmA/IrrE family metallo-endopeptidase [Virgibacillus pantothenticus]MBU8635025.1 ImmA/IrrE family metallo-endopeptidase [Virgibacillus pantothenticus]MBU8642854.1 ImmA/IrrE family metallo-endopeptidase [Virgibacillus pantothenticus]
MNIKKRTIDAFGSNQEVNGKSYYTIVLGNNKSFYRRQFDVAHELGTVSPHQNHSTSCNYNRNELREVVFFP